ncbi:MAG: GNAT family N-acetyltransferase [Acidobacteria bacterium]|nr:GNAT family N-acetyltransferase [Acidobacteriota bacterium]MBI3425722.1 GNAT family N-acetyltransferase [Acidobacteriota bacterium]
MPTVRAARLTDAAALAQLAQALLAHERQLNAQMGALTPWAASPAELHKQLRLPNTQFFVAESAGEVVGYLKVVALGLTPDRQVLGWRGWLKENCIKLARRAFDLVLRRPRPNLEQTGGYIAGIFVNPAARRDHAGRALVAAAEAWLRAQGLGTGELQVLCANTIALQFWESLGYEPIALSMRKPLL